ncbi:MAG: Trk system potassium transporter TrkA [Clostridia bacterium]|nr:Trk system potassium transporter TrkA [Clostridia bacterium]
MNIVIIGAGKVGYALSASLSKDNHNVTVVDLNNALLQKVVDNQDVFTVCGNGAVFSVQQEAGVSNADLLIAATSFDEVNVIACLVARKLGAKYTIARIRDPEYNDQLFILEDELGVSMSINPELAAARQIARIVSLPSATSVSSLVGDRVIIAERLVTEGDPLEGAKVLTVHKQYGERVLLCAVERQGKAYIPNGSFQMQAGDKIFLCGDSKKLSAFFRDIGIVNKKVKRVMLVGGGRIAFYLSRILLNLNMEVKIIERNSARCHELCRQLPQAMIIQGDGTEQTLLDEEGIAETDVFVALTDIDEENIIVSMYANQCGVPKIVSKINRLNYREILRKAGLESIVSPKLITAERILQYVRALQNAEKSAIKTLYRLIDDQLEVSEFTATEETLHLGEKIMDLPLRENMLITAIVRNNHLIIPRGSDHLEKGDSVVVIAEGSKFDNLNDIFAE